MSKEEMVTIEVPVAVAETYASMTHNQLGHQKGVTAACRKALDARKSKYERWRERIKPYGEHFQPGTLQRYNHSEQAQLMAAAPQLLEALIALAKEAGDQPFTTGGSYAAYSDGLKAIRAALPPGVADEVLGVEK